MNDTALAYLQIHTGFRSFDDSARHCLNHEKPRESNVQRDHCA